MAERKKFIWNTSKSKKVKTKEIREFNITYDDVLETYSVIVYGFFGGAVKVFESKEEGDCTDFIDLYTEDASQEVNGNDLLDKEAVC